MANINQIKKIDYAIKHDPNLLPLLFKDCSIANGLIISRLKRAVPHRIGIEFECCGSLMDCINGISNKKVTKQDIIRKYNIFDYSEDNQRAGVDTSNEIRVSIKDYSQLKGLYRILNDMRTFCRLPEGGGIHIHVDLSTYNSSRIKHVCASYLNKHIDEIESIFPKYEGKYNLRRVCVERKKSYVNFSYHNTVEFRIAPLTFDYETLIEWIIGCNKLVSKIISRCHLKTNKYHNEEFEKTKNQIEVDFYLNDRVQNIAQNNYVITNGAQQSNIRSFGTASGMTDSVILNGNTLIYEGRTYTIRSDGGWDIIDTPDGYWLA